MLIVQHTLQYYSPSGEYGNIHDGVLDYVHAVLDRYINDADEPNDMPRTIRFTINDSMFESSDNVTVTIVPLNDNAPMVLMMESLLM